MEGDVSASLEVSWIIHGDVLVKLCKGVEACVSMSCIFNELLGAATWNLKAEAVSHMGSVIYYRIDNVHR